MSFNLDAERIMEQLPHVEGTDFRLSSVVISLATPRQVCRAIYKVCNYLESRVWSEGGDLYNISEV